ncbi:unnamed protein product [Rotaria socialis]|uniref:F-box domain-containing protein n=1 Tax=Rotaria socialis TaxID=392032 RepID=A0A821KRL6_9BILA|nr:unnamed protein product [Rotaria socialis]CAF4738799.1 unnamed protein product [Rotaria socialis]
MKTKLEILPPEILSIIFSYLSWNEILESFWLLNTRFDSLICSLFSVNKTGIILNKPGVSYQKFSSTLFPLICNSLSLCSAIKYIHFDGLNSISYDIIGQILFGKNNTKNINFPNLKSLNLTECSLSESLIETLSFLIQNQLNQLKLKFNEEAFALIEAQTKYCSGGLKSGKLMYRWQQFIHQIFSDDSQLISLELDISKSSYYIHKCLKSYSHPLSNATFYEFHSCSAMLRYLHIHIKHRYFLEDLILCVPNLEELSVQFQSSLTIFTEPESIIQMIKSPHEYWFNKVPKLKYFTLKSHVDDDAEFAYLKWLLNNVNHVIKLKLHLSNSGIWRADQTIWKSMIDADFIVKYFLPDEIMNLKYFEFYICSKCNTLSYDMEKTINSFKTNKFFVAHESTNVHCFYDENLSYQHIFSFGPNHFRHFHGLCNHSYGDDWPYIRQIYIDCHPSLYLFLERLDVYFPRVSSIIIPIYNYPDKSQLLKSLTGIFKMEQCNQNSIRFQNVTKLQFGLSFSHCISPCSSVSDEDKVRAKLFARLISMPVQLKYLHVGQFEWLLYVILYASDDLRQNALTSVVYAEFCISSCNRGNNESIHIGKHLVPLLNTHMPNLQTLKLWRPDDFPWTSLRPNFKTGHFYWSALMRWMKLLATSQSINEHVTTFEQDLYELVDKLKRFTFLEIHGKVSYEKVEAYRSMTQNHFSQCRTDIQTTRFRLWI